MTPEESQGLALGREASFRPHKGCSKEVSQQALEKWPQLYEVQAFVLAVWEMGGMSPTCKNGSNIPCLCFLFPATDPRAQTVGRANFSLGILEALETKTEAILQERNIGFCPGKATGATETLSYLIP